MTKKEPSNCVWEVAGAANGDEGLREQLMVRSMKAGGIGAPEFANQSQYWPPNYHQPHYHTIQPSASSANMPGQ
jgi:hypothetical protein